MLKEMVIERDLGNYVVFEGVKDRRWVYENLCDFDLFIQPSRFEGFGLTVAEACVAGIPVLVCDNEGYMEVIDNGRLGLKFKTGDYHDLAAKLVDFTINGYKNELLIKAYDFTRANFDVSRTAGNIFTHIIASSRIRVLSMKKVITYGTYDLLHQGHLNLLRRAKELGDWLIVGVTNDNFDRNRGKLNVVNNVLERVEAVKATGLADQIIIEDYVGQKIDDIQKYDVDIFAIGSDWQGKFDYLKDYCEVVYLPRTEGISSTMLRAKARECVKIGIVVPAA